MFFESSKLAGLWTPVSVRSLTQGIGICPAFLRCAIESTADTPLPPSQTFHLLCPLTSFPHLTCRSYDVVSRHDCDVTAFGTLCCTSRLHLSKALQLTDLVFSHSVISLYPSNTVICGSNTSHEMNMGAFSVLFCPVCVNAAETGGSLFSTTGLRHSENGRPWATLAYGAVERARWLCGWMDIETVAGRKGLFSAKRPDLVWSPPILIYSRYRNSFPKV
jgi:hypothetical protein